MPLTPPPDYSKAVFALAVGASLAILVGLWSRSTLPHVGDNIHHLPHGGVYRDGTKAVLYGSPKKLNSVEGSDTSKHYIWGFVVALVGLILLLSRRGGANHCVSCTFHT